MEGLGDKRFRKAISTVGGNFYDDICKEFTRVPGNLPNGAKAEKFIKKLSLHDYDAFELGSEGVKVSAQLMGSNAELLELAAKELASEGEAPRVDLNCGCPANVVTGKGAGSSLLLDPNLVYECMRSVKNGCEGYPAVPSLKMRVGFDDASLFRENVQAACEGGAEILTVHGRTRKQGYLLGESSLTWTPMCPSQQALTMQPCLITHRTTMTWCQMVRLLIESTT